MRTPPRRVRRFEPRRVSRAACLPAKAVVIFVWRDPWRAGKWAHTWSPASPPSHPEILLSGWRYAKDMVGRIAEVSDEPAFRQLEQPHGTLHPIDFYVLNYDMVGRIAEVSLTLTPQATTLPP